VAALLLGGTFTESGWEFSEAIQQDMDEVPLHMLEESGESRVKPCTEVLMTQRAAARISNWGIMLSASMKGKIASRRCASFPGSWLPLVLSQLGRLHLMLRFQSAPAPKFVAEWGSILRQRPAPDLRDTSAALRFPKKLDCRRSSISTCQKP